jgi:hypothetical protein
LGVSANGGLSHGKSIKQRLSWIQIYQDHKVCTEAWRKKL